MDPDTIDSSFGYVAILMALVAILGLRFVFSFIQTYFIRPWSAYKALVEQGFHVLPYPPVTGNLVELRRMEAEAQISPMPSPSHHHLLLDRICPFISKHISTSHYQGRYITILLCLLSYSAQNGLVRGWYAWWWWWCIMRMSAMMHYTYGLMHHDEPFLWVMHDTNYDGDSNPCLRMKTMMIPFLQCFGDVFLFFLWFLLSLNGFLSFLLVISSQWHLVCNDALSRFCG